MSSLILAIGVIITVIILKKGFCGYICPFGTIQELLNKITNKKLKVSSKIDEKLRYLKYVILLIIIIATAITGSLVFRDFDPFITFFHFGKGIFWDYNESEFISHLIPFIILSIVLILSIFIERFWCKYLCPLGAVMNIFTKFSFTKIKRNSKTCIDCKLCDRICPMNVNVSKVEEIKSVECINCNKCVTNCPKNSLGINILNEKITQNIYIGILLILFFAIIGFSMMTNIWQSVPVASNINNNEIINPDEIKGWMSLNQIATESKININHFITDFNLSKDVDINLPIKDLSKQYNFETDLVREYVRNFKHNPSHHENELSCPWNLINDSYPGECGLYIDKDNNKICDLSE